MARGSLQMAQESDEKGLDQLLVSARLGRCGGRGAGNFCCHEASQREETPP